MNKEHKKQLIQLERLHKTIRIQWHLHKLPKYEDLLRVYHISREHYYPSELTQPLSFEMMQEFLSDREIELTTKQWLEENPPIYEQKTEEKIEGKNSILHILSNADGSEANRERPTSSSKSLLHDVSQDEKHNEERNQEQKDNEIVSTIHSILEMSREQADALERQSKRNSVQAHQRILHEDSSDPYSAHHDYGFDKYSEHIKDCKDLFLFWFQKIAAAKLLDGVIEKQHRGQLLLASAGYGKTFMFGAFLKVLRQIKFHKTIGSVSPWPYVVVTKATLVTKTKRDLERYFGLRCPRDVLVINVEQLRAEFGKLFLEKEFKVEDGVEDFKYQWREGLNPCFTIWDECQILKNTASQQSQIGQAFNELEGTFQVFSSATPFTRVCEAKCFAVATRHKQRVASFTLAEIDNTNWNLYARNIAAPPGSPVKTTPFDHSPAAIDRLMNDLDKYVNRVKGVKPQFRARNRIEILHFETEEGRKFYQDSVDRYKRKVARAMSDKTISAKSLNIIKLVAFLQYRIGAETNPDRIRYLARNTHHLVQEGRAVIVGVNFKQTVVKLVKSLIEDYGYKRNDISLIWGGGTKKPTDKQKAKAAILEDEEVMRIFQERNISMEDLKLDDVEALAEAEKFDPNYRLDTQTKDERQKEIDRFQTGKTLICIFTAKAGGVGLSLHHTDEYTKEKVRRKPSGYCYEEDIPNIPTRQRETLAAPSWSAIELVQLLGRGPRLTSLSDTHQRLNFFAGTEEERVAHIVSMKLRCLGRVVRQRESWEDVILGGYEDKQVEIAQLTDGSEADAALGEDEDILGDVGGENED